jgi:hypothetical protein
MKCLYQANKVNCHVFMLELSVLYLSTMVLLDFETVQTG